jgi:Zn-dependent peptidase ImmA (M78 family)
MKKTEVTEKQIVEYVEKYIVEVESHYGLSKHQQTTPYIYLSRDIIDDIKGEYCYMINEITIYYNNIGSLEELIRTVIHEYQHYLQSPSWMTRYYKMGYDYSNHPYEIAAYKEEENWKTIWKQAS